MTRPHVHTLYFTDRFRLSAAFERIYLDRGLRYSQGNWLGS